MTIINLSISTTIIDAYIILVYAILVPNSKKRANITHFTEDKNNNSSIRAGSSRCATIKVFFFFWKIRFFCQRNLFYFWWIVYRLCASSAMFYRCFQDILKCDTPMITLKCPFCWVYIQIIGLREKGFLSNPFWSATRRKWNFRALAIYSYEMFYPFSWYDC